MTAQGHSRRGQIRPFMVTQGRNTTRPLDSAALLLPVAGASRVGLNSLKLAVMRICAAGSAVSLAEMAARIELPLTAARVLALDLINSGHLAPTHIQAPDVDLLIKVKEGLLRVL
jgi:hypothetical protein